MVRPSLGRYGPRKLYAPTPAGNAPLWEIMGLPFLSPTEFVRAKLRCNREYWDLGDISWMVCTLSVYIRRLRLNSSYPLILHTDDQLCRATRPQQVVYRGSRRICRTSTRPSDYRSLGTIERQLGGLSPISDPLVRFRECMYERAVRFSPTHYVDIGLIMIPNTCVLHFARLRPDSTPHHPRHFRRRHLPHYPLRHHPRPACRPHRHFLANPRLQYQSHAR
jgi:hypothetical protein